MEQSQIQQIQAGKLIVVPAAPVVVSKHLVYWWAYLPVDLLGTDSSTFRAIAMHLAFDASTKNWKDWHAKEIVASFITAGEPWSIKYATIFCGHVPLLSAIRDSGNPVIIQVPDSDNHPLALHP